MRVLLRTTVDHAQFANSTRAVVRQVDGTQAVYNAKSMEQVVAEQTSGVRMAANIMSTYAGIALLLAVMGTNTRRGVLRFTGSGQATATEVAPPFDVIDGLPGSFPVR